MENFQRNKIIGKIFTNYLKKRLQKQYKVIEPTKKYIPDVDLILNYKQEELFLQLKQVIEWEATLKDAPKGTKAMIFSGGKFEKMIEISENKYLNRGNDISGIILILHSGLNDYFIPSDQLLVDRNKFIKSNFKGIYIVSPDYTLYGDNGKNFQNQFVFEIKSAFLGY